MSRNCTYHMVVERLVRALTTMFIILMGMTTFNLTGCEPASGTLPDEDVSAENASNNSSMEHQYTYDALVEIVYDAEDGESETIDSFTDTERDAFIDALQENGIYPDLDEVDGGEARSSLPWCSGYWGAHHEDEDPVEQRNTTSGLLYQTMPNCYMWAADTDRDLTGDCGEDYDDFMLSFYFGYHSQSLADLKPMLKWWSSSPLVRSLLGNLSVRVYEQTKGGGADNYNVYACVDDYFDSQLINFWLRKY